MTRQLKCVKCKKLIKEGEKAFRCSDCETYPFHEKCLDDDGYCTECAKDKEKEEEDDDTMYEVQIEMTNDRWSLGEEYTKKEAAALIKKIERAINTGKPKTMYLGPPMHLFVVKNIVSVQRSEA